MTTPQFRRVSRTTMWLLLSIQTIAKAATPLKSRGQFPRRKAAGFALIALLALPCAGLGQSLRLSSPSAWPGDNVAIEITLTSPEGAEPQVLQWETTFPTACLAVTEEQAQVGPVAKAADKSVS